jgi:hypothetical protein
LNKLMGGKVRTVVDNFSKATIQSAVLRYMWAYKTKFELATCLIQRVGRTVDSVALARMDTHRTVWACMSRMYKNVQHAAISTGSIADLNHCAARGILETLQYTMMKNRGRITGKVTLIKESFNGEQRKFWKVVEHHAFLRWDQTCTDLKINNTAPSIFNSMDAPALTAGRIKAIVMSYSPSPEEIQACSTQGFPFASWAPKAADNAEGYYNSSSYKRHSHSTRVLNVDANLYARGESVRVETPAPVPKPMRTVATPIEVLEALPNEPVGRIIEEQVRVPESRRSKRGRMREVNDAAKSLRGEGN